MPPTDLDDFDRQLKADLDAQRAGLQGIYAKELQDLLHLSGQTSTDGSIAVTPTEEYAALIATVNRASAANLSQAELKNRIVALGSTAVAIAKKVKGLAGLLA